MSATPKKVRRNGGSCICPAAIRATDMREKFYRDGFCKYGYCYSAKCRQCKGELFGMGPVGCPCDNPPRWTRYRGMRSPGYYDLERDEWIPHRAAVKPSIVKRR